jgi:anti-sigma regulatory factor (Ser/Thr protein kinase)
MQIAGTSIRDSGCAAASASVRRYTQVFPARPDQVRAVRRFARSMLDGCPVAGDAILCLSELATNAVIHSASGIPGGAFCVRAEILDGSYVRITVHDDGGPWSPRASSDDRPHGLDIVASVATDSGLGGNARGGWVCWFRIDWPPAGPGQSLLLT